MKTFIGKKSLDQIVQQCIALRLKLDARNYFHGGDYVVVSGGGGRVHYSTFNGRFFGTTDTGIEFSSDSTEHEACEWFQTLLSFFYIEKDSA
jgi:hypothetical protein